jgi:hypothetical protein
MVTSLLDLPPPSSPSGSAAFQYENMKCMVMRWKKYIDDGTFVLSVPAEIPLGGGMDERGRMAEFWTTPWPYWDMKVRAAELWGALRNSALVIFKVSCTLGYVGLGLNCILVQGDLK